MPAQKPKPVNINLLPKDSFSQSGVGKFLNWALSIGRYIVVFTEMIVILTFLSRFTLDRQLTDLNESILKKQVLLDSYSSLEAEIIQIQQKAQFISGLDKNLYLLQTIQFIADNLPADIVIEKIDTFEDKFILTARAYSQPSLSSFVASVRNDPLFETIHLDKISTTERDIGISFIIRADYKGIQPEKSASQPSTNSSKDSDLNL